MRCSPRDSNTTLAGVDSDSGRAVLCLAVRPGLSALPLHIAATIGPMLGVNVIHCTWEYMNALQSRDSDTTLAGVDWDSGRAVLCLAVRLGLSALSLQITAMYDHLRAAMSSAWRCIDAQRPQRHPAGKLYLCTH